MAYATPVLRQPQDVARASKKAWKKDTSDELWDAEWTSFLPPWGVSTMRAKEAQDRRTQSEQGNARSWQYTQSAQPGNARWEQGMASQWKRESHPFHPSAENAWQGSPVAYFSGNAAAAGHLGDWDCDKPNGVAFSQWMSEEEIWSLPAAGECMNCEVQMQEFNETEYSSYRPATSAEFMMANGHMSTELQSAMFSACNGDIYEPHWNSSSCMQAEYGMSPMFNDWREQERCGAYGGSWHRRGGWRAELDDDVEATDAPPLKSSDGSWGAQQRLRRERVSSGGGKDEDVPPSEVARQARGILNRLTAENFAALAAQMLALPLHTPYQLRALVAEIFEKATLQRTFLPLYSDLCVRLDAHLAKDEGTKVGGMVFRKALVTECQASFERHKKPENDDAPKGLSYEESYEREVKYKTRTLGNMRFIGELMVHRLLAGKVLIFLLNELLDVGTGPALESLVALLAVVAPAFEQTESYAEPLRDVFASLGEKTNDKSISTCVRVKIQDLLDLRARDWAPKDCAADQAPKLKACV